MRLNQLAKLKFFYEKLGISLNEPLIFESRFRMQKESFIVNELGRLNIFDIIDSENDYSWYIRGVYSQNIAQAYYSIVLNKSIISTIDVEPLDKTFVMNTQQIKIFLDRFQKSFKVEENLPKFDDLIELYSSMIYFKNYKNFLGYNDIWKEIIKEKPHLSRYVEESRVIFSKWI